MFINLAEIAIPSAWAHHSWTKLSNWPAKESTLIFVPLNGYADWGLGLGLDVEETIGSAVLNAALAEADLGPRALVIPPLRFQPQPFPNAAFSLDWDTAYELVESVLESIQLTGFRKVILFNTGPYNEHFTDVLGRDMRIKHGLQMFCVNLSGLGLDLHPGRQSTEKAPLSDRERARHLASFLLSQAATPGSSPVPNDSDELDAPRSCPPAADPVTLDAAHAAGPEILAAAAAHLARLIGEIDARAPLPFDGKIQFKTDYTPPAQ